jgi:RNA ligase
MKLLNYTEVKVKLWDIMAMDLYREMLVNKFIRINNHPTLPLKIIGYTEKAQFDNEWNEVTKQCRGLVVDDKFNIVARPFDKFLNYGQNQADVFLKNYAVEVTDKMDGSLGIIFEYAGDWHAATRGSFTSDQAIWATNFLHTSHKGYNLDLWHEETYLVEIIYPGNRVVLNYGDREDLVLLAARSAVTGSIRAAEDVDEWQGPKVATFPYKTLTEALGAAPRPNAEGYVIYFPELDYRVKFKQEDYISLHKIVTGLTPRRIWESMKEGKTLEDLLEIVPDEWHDWLSETYQAILDAYWDTYTEISSQFDSIILDIHHWWLDTTDLGFKRARKAFAEHVKGMQYQGFMFMLLDNKDISEKVWELVRPEAE